jgi:hypothetical protein
MARVEHEIAFLRNHDRRHGQDGCSRFTEPIAANQRQCGRWRKCSPIGRQRGCINRLDCDVFADVYRNRNEIYGFEIGIGMDEPFERGEG